MFDRKKAKKVAKHKLKKHYVVFVLACLLASLLGSDYASSLTFIKSSDNNLNITSISSGDSTLSDLLFNNDLSSAKKQADEITSENKLEDSKFGPVSIGYRNGVFASIANSLTSGSIFVVIYSMVNSLISNTNIYAKIAIVLAALFMSFFSLFVRNVYRIVYRRIFLEGYNYPEVKAPRFLFLFKVKKWLNATWISFLCELYLYLWNLTIIGGLIKSFSYGQVHFIAAENPGASAKEVITLSRKMMYGHKWEMFVYKLSFLGWSFLDIITLGLSGCAFSNAYKEAFWLEYYVYLRNLAIENKIDGYEILNDKYLYENPSEELLKETYGDYLAIKDLDVEYPEIKGIRGFFANYLGVVFKYDDISNEYIKAQFVDYEKGIYDDIFKNEDYPFRLCPLKEDETNNKDTIVMASRQYSLTTLILSFFIFSLVGWLWEVSLHLLKNGTFVNRGVMHGPWLPVYGSGVLIILLLLYRFRKSVPLEFFSAIILCGIVEYYTSVFLELAHNGMRWWDYSGYFLNINGRICAEGLLVFGLGGCAAVYFLVPLIDNLLRKTKPFILNIICILLIICFVFDLFYSKKYPNTGKGITDYDTAYVLEEDIC